jgi:hypothetical protein
MTYDPLDAAGQLAEAMRQMSDLLKGAVTTLVNEGWTEDQARTIVVATFANQQKGQRE